MAAPALQDAVGMTIWSRAGQKARRLGLIYACSVDPENLVITADAVRWSTRFVHHLTRRMLFMASTHVSENEFHGMCQKVVQVLRKWKEKNGNAWMPFWKLNRKLPWSLREHEELRNSLINQRIIEYEEKKTGGTPKRLYRLP
jgi:hypothetical protein